MTIGERLLKLRKEKNISQEELANELDVSRQTISKWETDQSSPDFDKIIPLCEYFGITSDELLTGNVNIKEAKQTNVKINFARNIAIAVMMYIIGIASLILCAAQFEQPIIGLTIMFVLIAVGTGMLIFNGVYYSRESEEKKTTKERTIQKQVTNIIDIIGVTIYLLVSFLTGAWHITWIIFLIVGVVDEIAKLIMNLNSKSDEVERSDINE
ncbi:MAG: helix-turn-helix domain-containing protein [Bacilli bacterium]|nr:helix-turn-helix domain-containing protein [Bacilli bacterium]